MLATSPICSHSTTQATLRLTTKPYSDDLATLGDASIHLTNASIQKRQDSYKENEEVKDRQTQSLEQLAQRLEADGKHENAKYLREQFDMDVKKAMVDVLKASYHKFIRKAGYFDLFGLDFMVSTDNKCFLIEANTNPALATANDVMKEVIPDAVDGTLELVLGLVASQKGAHPETSFRRRREPSEAKEHSRA